MKNATAIVDDLLRPRVLCGYFIWANLTRLLHRALPTLGEAPAPSLLSAPALTIVSCPFVILSNQVDHERGQDNDIRAFGLSNSAQAH